MGESSQDLPQGTLDLLILKVLLLEPMHGWGIARRIQQISEGVLEINQGSIYPAMHRLERKGWIASRWGTSEAGRRARFYRLSGKGERRLADQQEEWRRLTEAVDKVLQTG